MTRLNQKGLSLVQALVTLALLSGIGVMTLNIAEKQMLAQKRVRAQSDLENMIGAITQTLTDSQSCMNNLMGGIPATVALPGIAGGADENALGVRTNIPPVLLNKAGKAILGAGSVDHQNITIDAINIGPVVNGGNALQQIDLWVQYTMETGDVSGGNATLEKQKWMKLDNVLTVKLEGGAVVNCFTNETSVMEGVAASCESLGGVLADGICNLANATAATANNQDSVNVQSLENRFDDLTTWSNNTFLKLSSPVDQTMTGDLQVAGQVRIANANKDSPTSALNLSELQELLATPPSSALCGRNQIGYVYESSIECVNNASMVCGSGQRMIGLNASGPVCVSILGPTRQCNPGWDKNLTINSNGGLEFECVEPPPPIYTFTCSPSGWTGPGATCPRGPESGLCNSGTPVQGDTPCCESTPSTVCAALPALDEYTCNYSGGGWSGPTGSCTTETPDCSTTSVVPDGTTACCPSAPNPMKCPSTSTTLYTCNSSTGTWTSGATNCTAPSVDLGYCTTGTASNGDTACCSSSPVGTCPGTSSTRYRCTATSGWTSVGAGACGSSDALCTSGSATTGQEACCTSLPSPSTCPASCKPNGTSCADIADCNTCCNKPCADSGASCSHGGTCGGTCRPNLTCSSGGSASNCPGDVAWGSGASCSGPSLRQYACNTSGWSMTAVSCSTISPYCTSGSVLPGQRICCSQLTPPVSSSCPVVTYNQYRCQASGNWSATGSTCGSGSGACSAGTATPGQTACCSSPPSSSTCVAPVVNQYRCSGGSWSATGSTCGTPNGACSSGSGNDGDMACCTSAPSTVCNPPAPTGNLYSCNQGSWSGGSTSCSPILGCTTSASAVNSGDTRCCSSSPANRCGYRGYLFRCTSGSWGPTGTPCTTMSLAQCSSSTRAGHGSSFCCLSTPSTRCGVSGSGSTTGGSSGTTGGSSGTTGGCSPNGTTVGHPRDCCSSCMDSSNRCNIGGGPGGQCA